MLSKAVLITGASRGLGLEIVKQLTKCGKEHGTMKPPLILATCRNPESATELQELGAQSQNNVCIKQMDVDNFSTYSHFVNDIKPIVEKIGISCLINNAGISPKSTKYNMVNYEQMATTYKTNAIAPLLFSREILPFLKTAAEQNGDLGSLIVNMSSILGSVELNNPKSGGGIYPYRSSKTALNMITRSLSLDLRHMNINVVAIHPGWVKTDMGGKNAPLTTKQSIAGVLNVIRNFDTEHYNGQLIDYRGNVLPF